MKLQTLLLLFILLSSPAFSQSSGHFKFPKGITPNDYDNQHIIVKLSYNLEQMPAVHTHELKRLGLPSLSPLIPSNSTNSSLSVKRQKLDDHGLKSMTVLEVPIDRDIEELINTLSTYNWVSYAEPMYYHKLLIDPDTLSEPFVSFHWGHENANIYDAWDSTFGDPDVIIGVIDAGCKTDHQSLIDNFYYNDAERFGVDGVDDDSNGYVVLFGECCYVE